MSADFIQDNSITDRFDVVIVGAGPAGLTAGIYCSRFSLDTLIIDKNPGAGQLAVIDFIENYPGFEDGISGFDLLNKMRQQAERFGVRFVDAEVVDIDIQNLTSITDEGKRFFSKAVILATGSKPKPLGVKGENELLGKGVSYCATCDGPLFRGKEIVVVGGGDSAVGEAIFLSKFARGLKLIHRRDKLRAAAILQERLFNNKNVKVIWNSVVTEICGKEEVSAVKIMDVNTKAVSNISADGVFIFVGTIPNTEFLKGKLELDRDGFIITDHNTQTSVKGIYACGDVRSKPLRQIVTACAEGAQAAFSCYHYIEEILKRV